jgi:hypothetical protein
MRTWSRTLLVMTAALPLLALSLAAVVRSSGADTPASEWTQAQIDARYSAYRQRINQLLAAGKTEVEVAQAVAQEFNIVTLSVPASASIDLRSYLRSAESEGSSSTSTSEDIKLYTPTFSYDNQLHHYVMAASWEWQTCADNYNRACWTKDDGVGDMGGPDGMAIKVNRQVYRRGGGMSTNDNCGNKAIENSTADTDNGYGLGFVKQDTVSYDSSNGACAGTPYRYNWHRGTVSEIFDFQSSCDASTTIQVDSKIGHTWSSTSVTSIGISTSGISFTWSSSSHRWNSIPYAPAYGNC